MKNTPKENYSYTESTISNLFEHWEWIRSIILIKFEPIEASSNLENINDHFMHFCNNRFVLNAF